MTASPDRYLYALVDAARGDPGALDACGLGDSPVRLLPVGDIGAVVHDCDGLYDAEDPLTVRGWLLTHQQVVDAATAVFGTPLPVRFDTVLQGGDDAVREFVDPLTDEVRSHLDRLRGKREYRVGVVWDPDSFEERLRETDDQLQELAAEVAEADEGTAFLREKQYETRLRELRREHSEHLETALVDLLESVVAELTHQGSTGSGPIAPDGDTDGREVGPVSVLADTDREGQIGDLLDEYVDRHDVEVRFTGPWPPYSFTPEFTR